MNTHSYHLQWWSNFQDPWDNSWFCWIWHMYLEHQDCSIWSPLILYCILRSIHDIQWNIVCLFLDQLFHVTWDPIIYFINILHLSTSKHIMEHFLRRCKYLNLKLFSFDLMSLWRNYLEQMSSRYWGTSKIKNLSLYLQGKWMIGTLNRVSNRVVLQSPLSLYSWLILIMQDMHSSALHL